MGLTSGAIKVLLLALVIPAIGYGVSFWIISDINSDFATRGIPSYQVICASDAALTDAEVSAFCNDIWPTNFLGTISILAGLIGISVPLMYMLAAYYAGQNRARLAAVFPPLIKLSIFVVAATVLIQGAILTYAAYLLESYAIGRVHFYIIGAIGIGALIATWQLFQVSFSVGEKLTTHAVGSAVTADSAPGLFEFVRGLADKLNAKAPDNIVVGLDPTFFVTSCDVDLIGKETRLSGETLYLSAPLCRLMTQSELAAVVGHELGHFRGDDTVYSLRFAPVYAGLGNALGAIAREGGGISSLAKLPAISMLKFMYETFAMNEATISRERELAADEAGVSATSPMDLATSLVKVTLYSELWGRAIEHNVDRLSQGRVTRNLSRVFQDSAKFDVEQESLEEIMNSVLDELISHPTDTHPTLGVRLSNIDVDPALITRDKLLVPGAPAVELIEGYGAIEEDLTTLEHKLLVAMGYVARPDGEEQETNHLLRATYGLAAAMVAADGRIDPNEITVAEAIGSRTFADFDPVDFRDCCNNPEDLPDAEKIADYLNDILTDDQKQSVLRYLNEIAAADGEVADEEFDLLCRVADAMAMDRALLSRHANTS